MPEVQKIQKKEQLDQAVDLVRQRFGHFAVQRGLMITDKALSSLDPKNDHVIHPVGFLKNKNGAS